MSTSVIPCRSTPHCTKLHCQEIWITVSMFLLLLEIFSKAFTSLLHVIQDTTVTFLVASLLLLSLLLLVSFLPSLDGKCIIPPHLEKWIGLTPDHFLFVTGLSESKQFIHFVVQSMLQASRTVNSKLKSQFLNKFKSELEHKASRKKKSISD